MTSSVYDGRGQRKYLTPAEIDRFLLAADETELSVRSFCWMLAVTGCRISEALSMTVDNVDFEAKHVIIQSLKKRGKLIFRAVPLPLNFLKDLAYWFRRRSIEDIRLWPWSRMTGYRRICEVMDKAGIAGSYASPKGLRHGFGVRAIQANVPLTLVQRWLGHADIKTTAIYTSAMGPEEREIAARMWRRARTGSRAEADGAQATPGESSFDVTRNGSGKDHDKSEKPSKTETSGVAGVAPRPTSFRGSFRLAFNNYCRLIQNWVKCHKDFCYLSWAYSFLADRLVKPIMVAGR